MKLLEIALPTPLRRRFDYFAPEGVDPTELQPGVRVQVPFGRQQLVGLLLRCKNDSDIPADKLKPATAVIDPEPLLDSAHLQLLIWAANYYQSPIGEALFTALPTLLRQGEPAILRGQPQLRLSREGKGLPAGALKRAAKQAQALQAFQRHESIARAELDTLELSRSAIKALLDKGLIEEFEQLSAPPNTELLRQRPLELNPEQRCAVDAVELDHYSTYLLEGATGSGKTEVYLQIIEKVLRAGRQALVLIPEIGLTPQTIARFSERFSVPTAVLHSGLSDRERLQAWLQARDGLASIVIGTRSAIFTPLQNPGVIIIDEEHDGSFKQQDGFRYCARDLAAVRAQRSDIPLLLGTATPALETLGNALTGRYRHLQLTERAGNARKPSLSAIDIRRQSLRSSFAAETLEAVAATLEQGNQALVFINRRGFAPTLICHDCGWLAECPNCSARMTVHQRPRHLHCHHCDHQRAVTSQCPLCLSPNLQAQGLGTERSEEELQQLFPATRVLRIDRDTTRRKHAMSEMLEQIHSGEPCILVGTQMLAKGHHFPNVTLVAIIDADGGLFSADFRGPERMGQLIIQVAGRAGRADKPGQVIIQSHCVDHPLLQALLNQGYRQFAQLLLTERQIGGLPPYRYMALIKAEARRAYEACQLLQQARAIAEQLHPSGVQISYLGPLPGIMERRQDRYRFQLQINADSRGRLQALLTPLAQQLEQLPLGRKVRWAIDVDPQDMT